MRRIPMTAAALLAAAFPVHALDVPERINPNEPHMRRQTYNPAGRVE